MQKNSDSLASFNALYLHISEKVLTHTHTHLTWRKTFRSLPTRAREEDCVNPYKQRTLMSFFCSLFYALLPTEQRGKFHELFTQNIAIMNQKQLERWAYAKPAMEAIRLEPHSELMDTSFPNSGGHNKAGDDGDDLSAKQGWFDEDDEDTPQQWGI